MVHQGAQPARRRRVGDRRGRARAHCCIARRNWTSFRATTSPPSRDSVFAPSLTCARPTSKAHSPISLPAASSLSSATCSRTRRARSPHNSSRFSRTSSPLKSSSAAARRRSCPRAPAARSPGWPARWREQRGGGRPDCWVEADAVAALSLSPSMLRGAGRGSRLGRSPRPRRGSCPSSCSMPPAAVAHPRRCRSSMPAVPRRTRGCAIRATGRRSRRSSS
jgi:hypothetical protein